MNQQQKLKRAKEQTLERLKSFVSDLDQIGPYKWASLETIEGDEIWVTIDLVAKKNFDIDGAVEEFKDYQEMKAIKQKTRESKKKI